jgi:hypothetical protein
VGSSPAQALACELVYRDDMVPQRTDVVNALASGAGAVLGVTFHLAGRLRPAAKPLHPRGRLVHGVLTRRGVTPATGVRWLDEEGVDDVLVRLSRATGLPAYLPDVHGLALRTPVTSGRHGDLLFATTGTGRLTRFTLTATRSTAARPYTTLLPYRTPKGAMLLAALPQDPGQFLLACASTSGEWRLLGELTLSEPEAVDADPMISFDPVRNTIPGLEPYEWVRRLRAGAYAEARRSRRR